MSAPPILPPARRAPPRLLAGLAGILLALAGAGCAALDADIHLAPVYSQVSTAGGGSRTEGFFGAWRIEREAVTGFMRRHQFSPVFAHY